MSISILDEWKSEYKNNTTSKLTLRRFQKFLDFTNQTPERLCKLTPKDAKHLLLQFQAFLVKNKAKNNSILAYVSAARNFFTFCDIEFGFRRHQLVDAQKAKGYHVFSNGDLEAIFQVANVQYKALLAVATSTGFSLDDILNLDKKQVSALIKRARQNDERFVFFKCVRKKTNVEALAVLNPLAIEWIEKWIQQNPKETLFNVGTYAVDLMLKQLAKRSAITLTGEVRFHNIRKWVISKLSSAGFNSFQIKRLCAKKIPLAEDTYLQTLDQEIREKYPKIYESHLSIIQKPKVIIQKVIEKSSAELKETVIAQAQKIAKLEDLVERQRIGLQEHAKIIEKWSEEIKKLRCKVNNKA